MIDTYEYYSVIWLPANLESHKAKLDVHFFYQKQVLLLIEKYIGKSYIVKTGVQK